VAHNEVAEALARWREVERQLAEADEGTAEAEELEAEAAALQREVQRLTASTTPPRTAEGLG